MRIDAYNQVGQIMKAGKLSKAKNAYDKMNVASNKDQLQISQLGKDYQIAKQAVAGASDIREDRVAQLKERIANGSYNVDTEDFANKLLEKFAGII
ncbi:MAG: flagellar biosynthesis anti-sigma factor FlgM [Lachnospiraceae bacterium]|nr:flagellar biosynthesis anti-sigma factor FlgM [Lachnospiraceae bacterium]